MKDNIIQVDAREESKRNMARYSLYILYNRYTKLSLSKIIM